MYLVMHKHGHNFVVDSIDEGNRLAKERGWNDGDYSIKTKTEVLRFFNAMSWYMKG